MRFISSMPWVTCGQENEFRLKGFINLSRQKQNYGFYLFDISWYLPAKHVIFIYKLAFILFVMTPGAHTTGNIAVYGSAKQLVIQFMVCTANPTNFWSFAVTGAFF